MLHFFLNFLFLILFWGCATNVKTSGARLISPEAQGKAWQGIANGRIEGSAKYELNFDEDTVYSKLKHSKKDNEVISAGAEIGTFKPLDLIINLASTTDLGLKYQILGDRRVDAKKGSYSLSMVGFTGSQSAKNVGGNNFFDTTNIHRISYSFQHRSYGLLAGYRFWDPLLTYIGTHRIYETVSGKVTTDTRVLDDATFGYGNTALLQTIGLIYHAQSNYIVTKLEFSHLTTKWTRTTKHTDNAINFAFGFDW
ncbi:MAG: hypothetical protein AB7I27_03870 [Bacteriovoracaceae bacterium]